MLSYRKINLLFIALICFILILVLLKTIPLYFVFILLFVYISILSYGVVFIKANFYLNSIQKLKNKNQILLSFDDGPDPALTPLILDLLDQYDAKALFFIIGNRAEKFPAVIKEIQARGHIIGNHSWSHHHYFDFFSVNKMIVEVERTNELLQQILGEKPLYFRPPFGITNPRIRRLVEKTGMKSVSWSFRSYDTKSRSNERIIKKMRTDIKGGQILLFHDTIPRTYQILKEILPYLCKKYNLKSKL